MASNNGTDFITREGAELMFTKMLEEYEARVITPRHDESRGWHLELITMLAQRKGRREVFTGFASAAGIFWTCIEIWRNFHK